MCGLFRYAPPDMETRARKRRERHAETVRRYMIVAMAIAAISRVACSVRQDQTSTASPVAPSASNTTPEPNRLASAAPPPQAERPAGNHGIRTFDEAKRELAKIYIVADQRTDLYCGCPFTPLAGHGMRVDSRACGYVVVHDPSRAERIEWEHAVPASALGQTFEEWKIGNPKCVDTHGKRFHGRKCARLASYEFARMEADLHNLFPVVGEVNELRSDLPMGVSSPEGFRPSNGPRSFHFGACESAVEQGVFVPRPQVRGDLARAYKYMDSNYPERRLIDDVHRKLFDAWDAADPPDAWERERNRRIAARQGNANAFIRD